MLTFTAMPRKSGACMDHSHERMSFQTQITQVEKCESHIYSDVLERGPVHLVNLCVLSTCHMVDDQ